MATTWKAPSVLQEATPLSADDVRVRLVAWGLTALGNRALVWAAALGGAGAWGYVLVTPSPWRVLAATLYCLTILWPLLWRDVRTEGGK